jgi:hypothetical protein
MMETKLGRPPPPSTTESARHCRPIWPARDRDGCVLRDQPPLLTVLTQTPVPRGCQYYRVDLIASLRGHIQKPVPALYRHLPTLNREQFRHLSDR